FCECLLLVGAPSTVKSLAKTETMRPLIVPQPVTTPSPGKRFLSVSKSVLRCSTNMSNSSKEFGSSSRSMRSRAVSLPRACCASMRALPPPRRALARRSSSSWTTCFMGRSWKWWWAAECGAPLVGSSRRKPHKPLGRFEFGAQRLEAGFGLGVAAPFFGLELLVHMGGGMGGGGIETAVGECEGEHHRFRDAGGGQKAGEREGVGIGQSLADLRGIGPIHGADALGDFEVHTVTIARPGERAVPRRGLARDQFRRIGGAVADEVVPREIRELGERRIAVMGDAVDGGVGQLGQRHRLLVDLFALPGPFGRDRLG